MGPVGWIDDVDYPWYQRQVTLGDDNMIMVDGKHTMHQLDADIMALFHRSNTRARIYGTSRRSKYTFFAHQATFEADELVMEEYHANITRRIPNSKTCL